VITNQELYELSFVSTQIDINECLQTFVWYDFDNRYGIIATYRYDPLSVGATMFGKNPNRITPVIEYRTHLSIIDGSPLDVLNEAVGHTHDLASIHRIDNDKKKNW
jgi:hypothetical protein